MAWLGGIGGPTSCSTSKLPGRQHHLIVDGGIFFSDVAPCVSGPPQSAHPRAQPWFADACRSGPAIGALPAVRLGLEFLHGLRHLVGQRIGDRDRQLIVFDLQSAGGGPVDHAAGLADAHLRVQLLVEPGVLAVLRQVDIALDDGERPRLAAVEIGLGPDLEIVAAPQLALIGADVDAVAGDLVEVGRARVRGVVVPLVDEGVDLRDQRAVGWCGGRRRLRRGAPAAQHQTEHNDGLFHGRSGESERAARRLGAPPKTAEYTNAIGPARLVGYNRWIACVCRTRRLLSSLEKILLMASSNDNVSMALFCDFENVALGVRDANYDKFDIKPVLERLLLKGSIVVKKAYCDWDRYKAFKAPMHEANFELIEIPHVRQSGKNSADIRMVVDALDLCYTKSHVDTFVIISGDSDFSPLVSKLRENAKKVIGVGVKQSTSDLLVANCDEFIFYDDLVRESRRAAAKRDPREGSAAPKRTPEEESKRRADMDRRRSEAVDIAVGTFDALVSERGDSGKIWASVLKEAIKRRKPDFSESYYGFRTFGNLLEEAKARGLLEFGRDEKSGAYVFRSSGLVPLASNGDALLALESMPVAEAQETRQEARQDAPAEQPRKQFKQEPKSDARKDGKDGKRGRGRGGRSAAERFAERGADRGVDAGPVNHRSIADIKADQLAFVARQAAAEREHEDVDHHESADVSAQPAEAKADAKQEPRRGRGRGGRSAAERYAERNAERGGEAAAAPADAPVNVAEAAPVAAQPEAVEAQQDARRGRGNRGGRKQGERAAAPAAAAVEVASVYAPVKAEPVSVDAAPVAATADAAPSDAAPAKAKRASAKPAAPKKAKPVAATKGKADRK